MADPGGLFMFGVYGLKPARATVELFKSTGATGVLLLARNIDTPAQTRAYVRELEQRLGRPLLFAVDHEGGWVLRFRSGVTAFPGNAALGRTRDPKAAYETGAHMARELAPLGIRMNLAPVLDVETAAYNPGIGIRSFGSDPLLAGRLGAAFVKGMQEHGVSACAKHFPGKGAAAVDAHVDLPVIRLARAPFLKTHLPPFAAAVRAGADAVMSSHVRFPAFDSLPATFSSKIVRGLLREKLGYDGLVISDDLCMGAITKRWPVAEAAMRCLDAGHDMLMIAHDEAGMRESVELLRELAPDQQALAAARARIDPLLPRRKSGARRDAAALRLARDTARRAVRLVRRGALRLPLPARGTLLVVPDFREVRERFTFEGGPSGPEALVRRLAPQARLLRAPVLDAKADVSALARAAASAERVLFLCFEARRFPGQKAALRALARHAAKTAAVLIRSSRDLDLCPDSMTVLDAAGYRLVSLEAALSSALETP